MSETIHGGHYITAGGQHVDAHGRPIAVEETAAPPSNDLTALNGVGKAMATKLNEAGIYSFADLLALDVSTGESPVLSALGVKQEAFEGWQAQAQELQ